MANITPTAGTPVVLGGKDYHLRFKLGPLLELEKQTGKKFFNGSLINNSMGIDELLQVMRAGLVHEHPDITVDELGNLLDLKDLGALMAALKEAIADAFPPAKSAAEDPTQAPTTLQ